MIDIFDWVKDLEETYKYLIEDTKKVRLTDLESFQEQQGMIFKNTIKKKQKIIDNTLDDLTKEINRGMDLFENQFKETINQIRIQYQKNKNKIINLIINQLGLEF